jgi:hypothetical protein
LKGYAERIDRVDKIESTLPILKKLLLKISVTHQMEKDRGGE